MLTLLEMKVRALIASISTTTTTTVFVPNPVPFSTFASSQKIDQLKGITLTSITVSGVSGLTDADIPDGITATNYVTTGGLASAFPFTPTTNFGAAANSTSRATDAAGNAAEATRTVEVYEAEVSVPVVVD